MTDHDALLAAIRANPEEDTPRLALADWLDENAGSSAACGKCEGRGEIYTGKDGMKWIPCNLCGGSGRASDGKREHAELIRVQCRIAALESHEPDGDDPDGSDCSVCTLLAPLRKRESALLDVVHGPLCGGGVGSSQLEFRRGFLDRVECSADGWLARGDSLAGVPLLRAVKVTTWPATSGYRRFLGDRAERWLCVAGRRDLTAPWPESFAAGAVIATAFGWRWPTLAFEFPDRESEEPTPAEAINAGDMLGLGPSGRVVNLTAARLAAGMAEARARTAAADREAIIRDVLRHNGLDADDPADRDRARLLEIENWDGGRRIVLCDCNHESLTRLIRENHRLSQVGVCRTVSLDVSRYVAARTREYHVGVGRCGGCGRLHVAVAPRVAPAPPRPAPGGC